MRFVTTETTYHILNPRKGNIRSRIQLSTYHNPPPPKHHHHPVLMYRSNDFSHNIAKYFLICRTFSTFWELKTQKIMIFYYFFLHDNTMIDYLRVFFTRDPLFHFNPIILFGISLTLSQQVKTYKFRIGFLRLFLTRDPLFHFNPIIFFCISLSVSNKLIPKIAS